MAMVFFCGVFSSWRSPRLSLCMASPRFLFWAASLLSEIALGQPRASPRAASFVRRPSLARTWCAGPACLCWCAEQAYYALLALALWELPRTYWNRPRAFARDLYEDSLEKWRVFGEFGAPSPHRALRPLQRGESQWQYSRTNRYGGITTAHESNTHTMT